MSDEGEKVCPLCAEEMDLTDQQLKPCKCGYEICVWCWHQIMDLAEKDNTEGRCPACRIPYNKERIVGMAAKCERFVEKKVKSKSKSKTLDGRKQLSNVRVVQRNLVYIMGLPLNLADEDLLQRKEYFAQYGKVLKVSISRTSAGTIQPFPNNTCSVYITYSKEEEAVRCIQFVHGFTLEGRLLRACFGTTKYCHQWLKNAPCSNPDCLYLHEIGSAEVSFTKDEVISSYTRSRVQQITGATYDNQLRSGNILPPPAYDYCNNIYSSSENLTSRSATNHIDNESDDILASSEWQTPASSVRGSPPKNSSGRSVGLPAAAAWGMRASNSQQPSTSVVNSNGPSRKTPNTSSVSISFSTAVVSPAQVSTLHGDSGKKVNGEIRMSTQKVKLESGKAVTPVTPGHPVSPIIKSQLCTQTNKDKDDCIRISADLANSLDISEQSCGIVPEKDPNVSVEVNIPKLSSDMLSMHIDGQGSEQRDSEQFREPLTSSVKETCAPREKSESRFHGQTEAAENAIREVEDDLLSFDVQRLKDPELISHTSNLTGLSRAIHLIDNSRIFPPQAYGSLNGNVDDPLYVNSKFDEGLIPNAYSLPVKSDGYHENRAGNFANLVGGGGNYSYNLPTEGRTKHNGGFEDVVAKNDLKGMGESSIISNILSMDFDSWGESLASPENLAKLLGETEKQQGSLGVSSSWKVPTSNQSRFSFAREEDQLRPIEPSLRNFGQALKNNPSLGNRDYYLENVGYSNGFSAINAVDPGNFPSIDSHYSSNKFSVSRGQVSAPPGFSGPSRAPPPGFATHERMDQAFDVHSGSHSLGTSYLRNPYQAVPAINMNLGSPADIEFMDPAILAVGKGRLPSGLNSPGLDLRSTYSQQINNYENEARLQLLMQRSLTTTHQNQIYGEMGETYSSHSNGYGGVPSRMMEQTLTNNVSQFSQFSLPQSRNQPLMSNGHWGDGWSEVQHGGSDLNMAELLRNERLGMNKYFNGYEDSKFRLPSSGDLFNHRSYGI